MNDTLIYLAITNGKNRLEISGMLSVYQEFIAANSGCRHCLMNTDVFNPVPEQPEEIKPTNKKGSSQ